MDLADAQYYLDSIRYNWGDAYRIAWFSPDDWLAYRRDDGDVLRAKTPTDLVLLIREDYTRRPVSRKGSHPCC